MINPVKSDVYNILEKRSSGKKLNKKEDTPFNIHIERISNAISKDSQKLLKEGRTASVSTK